MFSHETEYSDVLLNNVMKYFDSDPKHIYMCSVLKVYERQDVKVLSKILYIQWVKTNLINKSDLRLT